MNRNYFLSKSRVLEHLQCPKRLYLAIHFPELKIESENMQALFRTGNQIGDLARHLYPDGIMIGDERNDLNAALDLTRLALRDYPDKPVFEATFQHDGLLTRADLLVPETGGYRMIEVKSSTSVKDYHLTDCTMQAWVTENSGVNLTRLSLMHVNSRFVYENPDNYDGLLIEEDISERVRSKQGSVPGWLAKCRETLSGEIPSIDRGPQCTTPFECPFIQHCSSGQPEYPVTLLPRNMGNRDTAEILKAHGYEDLRSVPAGLILNTTLERIRRITVSGTGELSPNAKAILDRLPYPRYFLDFESIQFTIPVWIGTKPFQQLPFQWSCHIQESDGSLRHRDFLDTSGENPLRSFAGSLIECLKKDGPIFVYNQSFEKARLQELAERYPDISPELRAIIERIVDLLPITRDHYYHPAMKGSWSIKSVLPTVTPELDYTRLEEVQHGTAAQLAYLEAIDSNTPSERKDQLRQRLLDYCKLDTLAMVRLAEFLSGKGHI